MPARACSAAAAPAPAKKTRPTRTPQTPFEQAEQEALYSVDKITSMRWEKGARQYLVRWEGYAASHDTWEPMENLVGCAEQIRAYERQREQDDKAAAEAAVARRQKAKDDAAAEQAALKETCRGVALRSRGAWTGSGVSFFYTPTFFG